MLFILHPDDKLRTVADYDQVVSAELPDPVTQPDLYKLVAKHMMHGPCGRDNPSCACMKNDKKQCDKKFPKDYCDETAERDGYPEMRRRDTGGTVITFKIPIFILN